MLNSASFGGGAKITMKGGVEVSLFKYKAQERQSNTNKDRKKGEDEDVNPFNLQVTFIRFVLTVSNPIPQL